MPDISIAVCAKLIELKWCHYGAPIWWSIRDKMPKSHSMPKMSKLIFQKRRRDALKLAEHLFWTFRLLFYFWKLIDLFRFWSYWDGGARSRRRRRRGRRSPRVPACAPGATLAALSQSSSRPPGQRSATFPRSVSSLFVYQCLSFLLLPIDSYDNLSTLPSYCSLPIYCVESNNNHDGRTRQLGGSQCGRCCEIQ